ncbi:MULTISPECIES: flagellar hook-associated family protein [unclassified Mesorhizobium]|uniref:flagellar hook-associated family protein n=1 Tax=unclassified Mesorhizobium TaxID=325217 RepID=UPI0006FBE476|nr:MULTISPECIES: flagellar hook-associated family protein [unclassified Mesorhizobium]KQZ14417.1 flagellar biosynthesis protein FlgL [Mesorhizobium sp. Root1471]KQZ36927.1 flagellar biosynthesis protein FlgL [Mesorhizobium sp. Root554]MDR7034684.1 flagellar hook-associated protein 3 FlgL [Mesorhizobium sp. BE184]
MKTFSVSSSAISNAMRYSQMRMQVDLVKAQKEMDTGRVADIGLALGARASQSVTFARDLDRLNVIVDSNALVTSRLKSTQDGMSSLSETAQSFLSTLTSAQSGDISNTIASDSGKATLDALNSVLNTSINGEYLFAGTNTDIRPLNDYTATSPAKVAFDAAFVARFGFTQNDPAAANIPAGDIEDFIDNDVMPQFMGAGWEANWSNATDQQIVSRIALNETAETSVSGNNDPMRKMAMAATIMSEFFASNVSQDAKSAVAKKALSLTGEVISGLGHLQAQTGIVEKRVTDASERMEKQVDLFERHILDLEGVDPYEAANRVNDLVSHIQTSFALTARIQQLSLLNFLT